MPDGSPVDPAKLWDQYRSVLFSFLRKGDSNVMPYLQLVTQPRQAEWHTNPEELNTLCNMLPRPGIMWEPYEGRSFTDTYREFLLNIATPFGSDGKIDARIQQWEDKLQEAEAGLMEAEMTCAAKFGQWKSSLGEDKVYPWEKFKASFCALQFRRAQAKHDTVLADAERDTYGLYGPFYQAKHALAKFIRDPVKNWTPLGNLASFARSSEAGTTNKFSIKITSKTSVTREKESNWNVGISASIPVFNSSLSLSASYSKGKLDIKSNTKEFQLEVGAGGLVYIPVTPGNSWFDFAALRSYRNGPFRTPQDYFVQGRMQFLVRGFFVISRPKITLFVGEQDASEMKKTSEMKANVSIMGINFDFGKNSRMQVKKDSDKTYRVEVDGNDPVPQLLAVDYLKL